MTLVAQRSRHRIRPFRLHRPETAAQAVQMRAGSTGRAAYMAGGIDVMARMKTGNRLDDVIYLNAVRDWTSIVPGDDAIYIGAGVTHQLLADGSAVRAAYPDLCAAWSSVANNRVRVKGTVAGNLMARNPAYDFWMAAVAVGADVRYLGTDFVERDLPVEKLSGLPEQALVTRIVLPSTPCLAFAVQLQWKPVVSFALSFRREQDAAVGRLAVGCGFEGPAHSKVTLQHGLFDQHPRETPADLAERFCEALPPPSSDRFGSAEYRRHTLRVLVRREIERFRAAGSKS
jgi:aerobic carbon-monoxide dehydrogenase medium subunit